jgi:predicted RNase H-like HicB family nuclease
MGEIINGPLLFPAPEIVAHRPFTTTCNWRYDGQRLVKESPMKYTVILQRESDGGYVATVPALPGCVSQGDSREEVMKNIEEAIELYLEDVRAAGEPIPVEDSREYVEVTTSAR